MASINIISWHNQSRGLSITIFVIRQITMEFILLDFIIPRLTTRMVIYPCHLSYLPAPHWAKLPCSGTLTQVFIWKLPSQGWTRTWLITQTTSTSAMIVVRMHLAALQWVASYNCHMALQTCIRSWWIPGTHISGATNRGCIHTLLLQSSIKSNRWRTHRLLWSSAGKQCMVTILFYLTVSTPKWQLRSLWSDALSQTSQWTTIAWMTHCISGCQMAVAITQMQVRKGTSGMPFPTPTTDDRPWPNLWDLTCEPVISTRMRATLAIMWTRKRR